MTELDKFKRRTIRSVARRLQQKQPPEELWAEMKKETGSDCRVLWERMRALCIKKLTRMLAVDDRSDTLPSIARLSLTDWLLVDLVLVHEPLDVIAMEKVEVRSQEPRPLVELFNLVQQFEVEGLSGEELACAWAAATVHYNRQGRQCSPMLLQRRWHQLKKATRSRFYHFWQAYRGNTRLLVDARQTMPTQLQLAVAKTYPAVITKPFPHWEELIKQRLVILPEEFESKMRIRKRPKPSSDPDIVVVEPVIETIELDIDSDSEEAKDDQIEDGSDLEKGNETDFDPTILNQTAINNDFLGVKIKSEPVEEEDGLSNVQVVATSHVPEVEIDDDGPDPDTVLSSQIPIENKIKIYDEYDDDIIEMPRVIPTINLAESPKKKQTEMISEEEAPTIRSEPNDLVSVADEDTIVDDIIKIKADAFCNNAPEIPKLGDANFVLDDLIKAKVDTFLNTPKEDVSFDEKKPDVGTIKATTIDLMADLNFIDDGIEFLDDGIEFEEEEYATSGVAGSASKTDHSSDKEIHENKFDLKLLMDPVVYTTKLDQMNIFMNKPFKHVQNKEDIEQATVESKPVSKKSFNINGNPEDRSFQMDNSEVLDDVAITDDLFTNHDESHEDSDEYETVSINSNMLMKPKFRTYNPILLCKNPDFNTKLRRLNIGFYSSTRNRQLLNACIPMTVDVSKQFESKLVNGTLYLKPTGTSRNLAQTKVMDNQTSSVVPAAMHVQSLMDNSKKDIRDLIPIQPTIVLPDSVISERTKTINLPDINKVRRINQQLLTAQVPPTRLFAGDSCKTPTPKVPAIELNNVDKIGLPEPHAEPIAVVAPTVTVPETTPTVVKVENEVNLDGKSIPPDGETIAPPETLPLAREKLLKIINQVKISTQEALTRIDMEAKKKETEPPKKVHDYPNKIQPPIKIPERKKHTINRVAVPWTPRFTKKTDSIDDFLITDDTLNKMLHLMIGENKSIKSCSCCSIKQKKAEVKKQNKLKKIMRQSSDNDSAPTEIIQDNSDNSNSAQDQQVNKPTRTATIPKPVLARGRVVRYCCWARQKILNRKRITKHMCPLYQCECCCRDELSNLLRDQDETRAIIAIDVSDDEGKSLKKACESIENVVQQSRELTQPSTILQPEESVPYAKTGLRNLVSTSTNTEANMDTSGILNQAVINAPIRKISDRPQQPIVITRVVSGNKLAVPERKISPQPKVANPEPPLTSTIRCVVCSCQTAAVSQGTQRNIVIDASRNCPLHPTPIAPKNEKVLYLHSKSISKTPSESPIFLGKNKILLTTVKFPRKDDELPEECEAVQVPKIIPTLPLPTGVQLVLLPTGDVTYTIEQGIELSEAQLATLPTIIAAVQEQLNSTTVPSLVSLNKDSDVMTDDIQSVVNVPQLKVNSAYQTATVSETISMESQEKLQDVDISERLSENLGKDSTASVATSVEPIGIEEKQQSSGILQPMHVNPSAVAEVGHAETGETISGEFDNSDAEKDSCLVLNDDPAISETSKVVQKEIPTDIKNLGIENKNVEDSEGITESKDKEATANRKSLLSDLMEMSGISAEDTTASEQPAAEQCVPEVQSPNSNCIMVNAEQARNLPELTPVTSFAELKYACEQNGKFFKLDFETGIIVPINVCIKKNPKPNMSQLKTVIDLTDDMDDSKDITDNAEPQISQKVNQVSPSKNLVQYTYKGKTVNVIDSVKPIKLFKAVHQREPRNQMTVVSLTPKKTLLEKKKQILDKVEAKIDLIDSDAPMEEEYLVDSSEGEDFQTEPMRVEALDMDAFNESDSSDDEPLAKKSKRMKETVSEKESKDVNIETNIILAMDHLDKDIPDSEHDPSEAKDDTPQKTIVAMASQESPDGAEDTEAEIGAQPVLRFMSVSDNEGGEDDSILGI